MGPSSAPSPRIGRGAVGSALTLHDDIADRDDSPLARTSRLERDSTRTGGSHREVPEVPPRAEVLDARWQSVIDAATD
jgi:hypothetical protein